MLKSDLKLHGPPNHFPNRESTYKNCFDDYDFGSGNNASIQERVMALVQSMKIKLIDSYKNTSSSSNQQDSAPFEALNVSIVMRKLMNIIKSGRENKFQLPDGVKYKSIAKKTRLNDIH